MFKKLTIILILALLCNTALARNRGLTYHEVQVVDEVGRKVTTISSVEIYNADTTTDAVIYSDRALQNTIQIPMTTGTTNSTLSNGYFYWWGNDGYDYSVTDGTNVATNADHRTRTSSEGRIVFPTYLTAIDSSHYLNAQTVTFGTASDWVAGSAGSDLITWTPKQDSTSAFWIGSTSKTADLNLWGASAGLDLMWDASRNQWSFRDSAVLGFGGAAASAAADFTMYHTAASAALVITAVAADETVVFGDETIATDVRFDNTTVAGADVHWDDSEEEWNFGAPTLGVDVKFWGLTASTFMLWDESDDELEFDLADLKIHEGSQIEFYNVDTVDWTMDVATGDRIKFTPAKADDTANVHLGDATYTSDLALFGATASTVVFDANADRVKFDAYDIDVFDTSNVIIGSDDEFVIDNNSETLRIIPSDTDDDFKMHLGDADHTMDLRIYGKTASELILWDASADSLTIVGDLTLFTMTGTTLPFHVNVTGTVSGEAAKLETTDGGVTLLADGSANGDILIDAEDKITIISTDADGTDSIYIHANGGTSEVIKIHSDLGNTAASVNVVSDAGGITLNASSGVVFTQGQTKTVVFTITDVEVDETVPPGTTSIGTTEQADFDVLGFDADGGSTGDDYCFINWIVPAGYIADSADLHVYWTFSTAEDTADECVIDGTVNATAPGEDIDVAGTAMVAVTSVITDAATEEGSLVKTSLDIEVEDIVIGDLVCIAFFFDEDASAMANSGTADVLYFEITYESTE